MFLFLANEKPLIKLCNCLSPLRTIFMCTQNMATGLNLYLGSQSICMVGFGFPTMCGPSPGDPVTHSYLQHPFSLSLSLSQNHFPFFWDNPSSFSLSSSQSFQPPFFSSSFLIYSMRSMRVPWLFLIISENGVQFHCVWVDVLLVVVIVALELVPLSKRMFGSDTP